jgi:hypothetical protein
VESAPKMRMIKYRFGVACDMAIRLGGFSTYYFNH